MAESLPELVERLDALRVEAINDASASEQWIAETAAEWSRLSRALRLLLAVKDAAEDLDASICAVDLTGASFVPPEWSAEYVDMHVRLAAYDAAEPEQPEETNDGVQH